MNHVFFIFLDMIFNNCNCFLMFSSWHVARVQTALSVLGTLMQPMLSLRYVPQLGMYLTQVFIHFHTYNTFTQLMSMLFALIDASDPLYTVNAHVICSYWCIWPPFTQLMPMLFALIDASDPPFTQLMPMLFALIDASDPLHTVNAHVICSYWCIWPPLHS